jgi:hypothetical protein
MTPAFPPEDNLLHLVSDGRIGEDGGLSATLHLTGRGVSDGRLRGQVAERFKRDVRAGVERLLAEISSRIELDDYHFGDPEDFSRDMTLELSFRIPDFAQSAEEDLVFHSPALSLVADHAGLSRLAAAPEGEEREHDLFLWAGQRVEIEESLRHTSGYSPEAPDDVNTEAPHGKAELSWTTRGRTLRLEAAFEVDRRLIPAEDVPALRAVSDSVRAHAEEPLYGVRR